MLKLVEQKLPSGRIQLKSIESFVSTCHVTRGKDETNFELSYVPGRVTIDVKKLEADLTSFEKEAIERGIPMEVIPIEVLKRCIEHCVNQRAGRYAAPEELEIHSTSKGKAKDWQLNVNLKFEREIS